MSTEAQAFMVLPQGMISVLMVAALAFFGFLGHLVGDYVIQTGWMAANKAKPLLLVDIGSPPSVDDSGLQAITSHALTWAFSVFLFMVTPALFAFGRDAWAQTAWACIALGAIHWVQDRRTPVIWLMKRMGKDPGQLWLLIVFDNTLHLLEILGAAVWIVWRCM